MNVLYLSSKLYRRKSGDCGEKTLRFPNVNLTKPVYSYTVRRDGRYNR